MRPTALSLYATPLVLIPYLLLVPPILVARTWMHNQPPTQAQEADLCETLQQSQSSKTNVELRKKADVAHPFHKGDGQSRFTYGISAI
jgi:hypothetical protein